MGVASVVFELETGASEVSFGRLDTTKTTGHTSDNRNTRFRRPRPRRTPDDQDRPRGKALVPSVLLFYLAVGGALQTAAISGVQGAVQSEIVWAPCSDVDANAECASIDLPL